MISDTCNNWQIYSRMAPELLKSIFDFIKTVTIKTENKRYDICGNDVYALVQQYTPHPLSEGKIEAHRKYIDIQAIIRGKEIIGISKLNTLKEITAYDSEKDYSLFENAPEQTSHVKLCAGDFMILFPEDGHMPGISVDGQSSEIKKVVVKVLCEKLIPAK
jgi:YhcH/YjgK/YiaL family protein